MTNANKKLILYKSDMNYTPDVGGAILLTTQFNNTAGRGLLTDKHSVGFLSIKLSLNFHVGSIT